MAVYRIYVLSPEGHVAAPAEVLECPDDREAIRQARQYAGKEPVEVWEGTKRVFGSIRTNKAVLSIYRHPGSPNSHDPVP
jgi:hypothetical protein